MTANSNQFSMYHQLFKSPTRLTKRYANDKKQNISHPTILRFSLQNRNAKNVIVTRGKESSSLTFFRMEDQRHNYTIN